MQAVDPVCGMTVTVSPDTPHLTVDGEDVWFCGPGCRRAFARSDRDARQRRTRSSPTRTAASCATVFADAAEVQSRLDEMDYLVDEGTATALFFALTLGSPLLLEGEPGVGKTTAAKALARALVTPLIRLQCYEGLTAGEALYEWNYQRQLLAIRLAESPRDSADRRRPVHRGVPAGRPILRAVRHRGPRPPVLLIDEIDRADDEFEALLFEFLGEASITDPGAGHVHRRTPPVVILTSNRSRDLHDALRRRCLYHWIDFPAPERAAEILRRTVPAANER